MSDLSWLPQDLQPPSPIVEEVQEGFPTVIEEQSQSVEVTVEGVTEHVCIDYGVDNGTVTEPIVIEEAQNIIEEDNQVAEEVLASVTVQEQKKSNAGRPTVMTDEVLEKLKQAFLWGCSDREACLYAEIDPQTLYNYQTDNPDYSSKKQMWKENPILKARAVVVKAMESGDKDASKWYLERKLKAEFATRVESTGKDGNPIEQIITKLESNYDDVASKASGQMVETQPSV